MYDLQKVIDSDFNADLDTLIKKSNSDSDSDVLDYPDLEPEEPKKIANVDIVSSIDNAIKYYQEPKTKYIKVDSTKTAGKEDSIYSTIGPALALAGLNFGSKVLLNKAKGEYDTFADALKTMNKNHPDYKTLEEGLHAAEGKYNKIQSGVDYINSKGEFLEDIYHSYKKNKAKANLTAILGEDHPIIQQAKQKGQLSTFDMTPRDYSDLMQAKDKHTMLPLNVQKAESDLALNSLQQNRTIAEMDLAKAKLEQTNLEKARLENELAKRNTVLGRMSTTSAGQIAGPLLTGALITGGGYAMNKVLNTVGTLNALGGIGDPTAKLVSHQALPHLYQANPNLQDEDPEKIKRYYGIIYQNAPHIAKDVDSSARLIKDMIDFGGPSYVNVKDMLQTQNEYANQQKRNVDLLTLNSPMLMR